MKRIFSLVIVIVVLGGIFSYFRATQFISPMTQMISQIKNGEPSAMKIPSSCSPYEEPVYICGSITRATVDEVLGDMSELPQNIKDAFAYANFHVEIVPEDHQDYSGQFDPKRKVIEIVDQLITPTTTLHEFGHFLDVGYYNFTDDPIFKTIYETEKNQFTTEFEDNTYFTGDIQEYFAESFAQYYYEPEQLKHYTPQTYQYIKEAIPKLHNDLELIVYWHYN